LRRSHHFCFRMQIQENNRRELFVNERRNRDRIAGCVEAEDQEFCFDTI